jgi:regulatory protein
MKLNFSYQKKNKRRLSVFCEGEYLFSLSETTFVRENLRNGMEVSDIAELQKKCQKSENYAYCLNILAKKEYTKKEIYDKLLKRECTDGTANEIIDELTEKQYISDDYYKKAYTASRLEYKKDGFNKIRQDLYRKGIVLDEDDYNECEKNTEIENLRELINNLLEKNIEPPKIIARLIRKGYNYSDVRDVLGETRDMDDEYTP